MTPILNSTPSGTNHLRIAYLDHLLEETLPRGDKNHLVTSGYSAQDHATIKEIILKGDLRDETLKAIMSAGRGHYNPRQIEELLDKVYHKKG